MYQDLAVSSAYKWFKDNVDLFRSKSSEMEFKDSGSGLAYVRVDTVDFMSELNIKDKGFRLEIERIDRNTHETSFPYTGECETLAEFEKCLAEFIEWFEAAHA